MDVQTDQAGLQADPFATAVVPRTDTGRQGQLFSDGFPTYADTDQIPAVQHGARGSRRSRSPRLLRFAVAIVALAVIAGAVALGLVKAGVIDSSGNGGSPTTTPPTTHHVAAPPSRSPAVTQVSTGPGTATYTVNDAAYSVTVSTSTARSWISMGAPGQRPAFAGILSPNSSHKAILLGPSVLDVGAGGTTVTVTAGRQSTTLTPPSAPFTYQFQLQKS
jgi:hypothetical protein